MWGNGDVSGGAKYRACASGLSLTGVLDHRLQHPVALVPSPPERQRLVLIQELLQVGGRGGMGGAEVEGAVARVALWIFVGTDGRANSWARDRRQERVVSIGSSIARISSLSPCSKTTGFLSANACLISIWQ